MIRLLTQHAGVSPSPLWRSAASRGCATVAAAVAILLLPAAGEAASVGQAIRVSPAGHTVAEFSAATSPLNPRLMAASAIDNDTTGRFPRCAVYVSSDGGASWSEVSAWPRSPQLQPAGDPWVAVGPDGTIHATCLAATTLGSRVVYVQSRDEGASWTAPREVTPLPARFRRQSADKDALTIGPDGSIYVCFSQILTTPIAERGLIVARSTDDGTSWTARNTGIDAFCNGLVATADGTVTTAFVGAGIQYGTVTSTDGGESWSAPVILGTANVSNSGTINFPSIVHDMSGRTVVAEVAGTIIPALEISIENGQGALTQQWQLPAPASPTCANGRLLHAALTAAPAGLPALQIACKTDATTTTAGRQEVWLYGAIDQPATTPPPLQTAGFELPAGKSSSDEFARRFPDGGDYWSLTWTSLGSLSMWIDPRAGGGPGELWATPVNN
jgi:hypothetical protein